MPKPKQPLLSLGARGTIADSLTFQKRGQRTIARSKPIPKDPESPAQLAQRQRYKDAVAVWNALSPPEKEAWRGVCPGLTAYQCFMSSELKYVAPPPLIDIGSEAIDRNSFTLPGRTYLVLDNPANASGIIHTIHVRVYSPTITQLRVGTLYLFNGTIYTCRDSVILGDVDAGFHTFNDLSIDVEAGDFIGFHALTGNLELSSFGYLGSYWVSGQEIEPGRTADYTLDPGATISLYGIGETSA